MKNVAPSWLPGILILFVAACDQQSRQQSTRPEPVVTDSIIAQPPQIEPNTYASVDISPMDMSYFPVDYPKIKMANPKSAPPVARLIYSRPQLQRRPLFNGILKYGEHWRLGANEASEISFYKPVSIQGRRINPGRYTIYGIPQPNKWTIVINSNIDTWGLKQDTTRDVGRFDVPVSSNGSSLEFFTMVFEKTGKGANLVIAWADVVAKLPIEF